MAILGDLRSVALLLRITLVMLLLHGATSAAGNVQLHVICGAMLIFPPLVGRKELWAFVLLTMALDVFVNRAFADNHKYLMTYWVLVCLLAASRPDAACTPTWNGRVLIGLTFSLATVWKLAGGQYVDGSFWEFTLLTDRRVSALAASVGAMTHDQLAANRRMLEALVRFGAGQHSIPLESSDRIAALAGATSWFGLLCEGLVAAAFLSRFRHRDWLLITFIFGTYLVLPVLGFAFVLAVLGFAQAETDLVRRVYLILLAVVQITSLPWLTLLA